MELYNNNNNNRWKCCFCLLISYFVGMISKPTKESTAPVNFIQTQIQRNFVFSSIFLDYVSVLFFCPFLLFFLVCFLSFLHSIEWWSPLYVNDAQTLIMSASVKIQSTDWQNDELNQFSITHTPNLKGFAVFR